MQPEILHYITFLLRVTFNHHTTYVQHDTVVSLTNPPFPVAVIAIQDSFKTRSCMWLWPVLVYPHRGLLPNLCVTQRPPVHHSDPAATLSVLFLQGKQTQQQRQRDKAFYRCTHTDGDRQTSALRGVSLHSFRDILG